jgi:hypothetical protein
LNPFTHLPPAWTERLDQAQRSFPALAFFGGFLWDAVTLGRSVGPLDLWILSGYLAIAAVLLWWLGHRQASADAPNSPTAPQPGWRESGPYLLLQFCFGGLFSALFIFYFKSSSHFLAGLWVLGLGILLVANEFLDDHYRRFTLTWALFGLCAMLLLTFVIPHVVGSISALWFVLGTLAGAGLAHGLRLKTSERPGRILPVWLIAVGLLSAYVLDIIPPVPLVKKDIDVGHALTRSAGEYRLLQEKSPWWVFWRRTESEIHLAPGEPIYCVSAVFAPSGLSTRLVHHWQRYEKGWTTYSRIPFSLSGGRGGGYRGFTYKRNLAPGEWKVRVETEDGRTVAIHRFEVSTEPLAADAEWRQRVL